MEENKKNVKPLTAKAVTEQGNEADKTPSTATAVPLEQVQQIVQQAEGKMRQVVEQLKQMNQMLTDKTIDQLFQVIKHAGFFDPEFVEKCSKTIETYLTSVAFAAPENPEAPASDKDASDKEKA